MGVNNGASALVRQSGELIEKLPGGIKLVDAVELLVAWGRANSVWPLVYATSCCAIEMMSTIAARHDLARFGYEVMRASVRQADMIILAGTISEKMAKNLVTLYEQMPAPKYTIAMGSCAISGGPFYYDSYSVVKGGDRLVPVDVYIPGCPPRPEALIQGILQLQEKIKQEGRRRPWKVRETLNAPFEDLFSKAQAEWAAQEKRKDEDQREAREQFKRDNPAKSASSASSKSARVKKEEFPNLPRRKPTAQGISNWTLLQMVQEKFPAVEVYGHPGISPKAVAELGPDYILDLVVPPEQYRAFAEYLKNEQSLGLDMLIQLTCVDWKDSFDIVVQLLSCREGHKLFFRSKAAKQPETGDAEMETISDLYFGAEWHEREVYDFFGVRFRNNQDMRRIFLENDFPGYPLRKDYDDPTRVVKRPY
ncbi:NADH-quinone oxidoreductase subunit NuoB [Candidatus Electronema sp. TJ]|uniref:NADH-quinone oxidoreductase subunit NuoB n=1 Tax=Candidatus Electronema sp. TJ TaxID=3401573 RepID=UPI003AA8A323